MELKLKNVNFLSNRVKIGRVVYGSNIIGTCY